MHREIGGPGLGLIGMCFSGGYALATVLEPSVLAPVMAEPALPVRFFRPGASRAPGLSPSDAITAGRRIDAENLCVLGFRFTLDRQSRHERFERLRRLLGDNFEGIEIRSGPGTAYPKKAHSVLTDERIAHGDDPDMVAAVQRLRSFLGERLHPVGA